MVEINLLAWRENLRKRNRNRIIFFYAMSVGMALLIFLSLRFYFLQQVDDYKNNNAIQSAHKAMSASNQEEDYMLQEARLRHQRIVFNVLNVLGSLRETLFLSDIFSKEKIIQISGEASLFADIKQFMSELLSVPQVDYVKLISLQSSSGRVQFQLQLVEQ